MANQDDFPVDDTTLDGDGYFSDEMRVDEGEFSLDGLEGMDDDQSDDEEATPERLLDEENE